MANRQIKDPVAVSNFFFTWALPSFLAALPLFTCAYPQFLCSHSTVSQKKNKGLLAVYILFKVRLQFDVLNLTVFLPSDKVVERDNEMQKICDNGGFCCTTKNSRFTTTRN